MRIEYLIVKEENDLCQTKEAFISFLKTNTSLTVGVKEIVHNKFSVRYTLETDTINNSAKLGRYFILELERKDPTPKYRLKEFEIFVDIARLIKSMLVTSNYGFNVINIHDSVSAFYSESAYPYINTIENLMRKLIFKFMFMKIGINWIELAVAKEVQTKLQKKGELNKTKNLIQESLYEADFIVLMDFIFKAYSTITYENLLSNIRKAKSLKDIDFHELKGSLPKSNWDRFFSKFVKIDNLNGKWEELYDLRNKIAHNKPISKKEYDKVVSLVTELQAKLMDAINNIQSVEVADIEKQNIVNVITTSATSTEPLSNFHLSVLEKFLSPYSPLLHNNLLTSIDGATNPLIELTESFNTLSIGKIMNNKTSDNNKNK